MCADNNSETLNTPGHIKIVVNSSCSSPVFTAFCFCSSYCLQFLRAARGKRKRYSVHLLRSQYLLHAGRLVGYGHPEGHRVHQRKFGGSIWKPEIIKFLMRLFWLDKIRELPCRWYSLLQPSDQGFYPWMDHPVWVGGSVPTNTSSKYKRDWAALSWSWSWGVSSPAAVGMLFSLRSVSVDCWHLCPVSVFASS